MAKKLWNAQEVADYLGFKIGTIYHWISQEKIPHNKVGRMPRFDQDEIDAWLKTKNKPAKNPLSLWAKGGKPKGGRRGIASQDGKILETTLPEEHVHRVGIRPTAVMGPGRVLPDKVRERRERIMKIMRDLRARKGKLKPLNLLRPRVLN
jgi:excisionase family DNA binding protein